jgi:hypothetical protein
MMILHLKIRARLSSVRNPSASQTSFGIIHPRALYIQNQPFVSKIHFQIHFYSSVHYCSTTVFEVSCRVVELSIEEGKWFL